MMAPAPHRIGYFGKIRTRADFIKETDDVQLMNVLDGWLAGVVGNPPPDARWKRHYDALAPLHFAFVARRRRHAIAGHLVASADQSGRRFPFILTRTLEVADPSGFVSRCPLVLGPLWSCMEAMARRVLGADDPSAPLMAITQAEVLLEEGGNCALAAFLATANLASLDTLLGPGRARLTMLGLGLLLQPVLECHFPHLEKSLTLPLPEDEDGRWPVAAFWLELIAPFLRRADLELALFIARIDGAPVLVVGFRGASALTLQAIIDPALRPAQQVGFAETAWIDAQLGLDPAASALASYLEQPQLPLKLARDLFLQTFIGAPR